jgi:hypothetical protein
MLRRLAWYMFTDVSEVLSVCITMIVLQASSTSETSVYFYILHSGTSQMAAFFNFFLIGPEMHKF